MLLWLKRYDHKANTVGGIEAAPVEQVRPSNPMLAYAGRMMVRVFPFLFVLGL